MRRLFVFVPLFFALFTFSQLLAQQQTAAPLTDTKALLDRIDQLEKRVQELERDSQDKSSVTLKEVGQTVDPSQQPSEADQVAPERQVSSGTLKKALEEKTGLQIRGFGQASVIGHDMQGERSSFSSGNFTLLLTSRLSDKLSALGEIALDQEGYNSPEFGVALERALLRYEHSDYLKIEGGRYFSSIGYYNTAFYNADWAQTTMRRPTIASFQDDGGLMPMQRTGLSLSGRIPSGKLGLHYVAEVGGGDIVRGDGLGLGYEFPIQARTGFNLALFSRPQSIQGLQVGGSFFHDTEIPFLSGSGGPLVRQSIYSFYSVYENPKWEFLNEAYLIHHGVQGFREFNIPAFYTQVSHRLTSAWRPYFRYSYVNGGRNDPMLLDVAGRVTGIETGARYNFSDWAGVKFEYARMSIAQPKTHINFGGTQLVFTF